MESTAVAEPEIELAPAVASPEAPPAENVSAPGSVAAPADGSETPAASEVAAPDSAAPAGIVAAPEPVRPRTLVDVYNDVQANKPVPPSEYNALQNYYQTQARAEQEDRKNKETLANLFPAVSTDLVASIADHFGLTDSDRIVLESIVEKRLIHGDGAAHSVAQQAVLQPLIDVQGGALAGLMGNTREANNYVANLQPAQYIATAFNLGRRAGVNGEEFVAKKDVEAQTKKAVDAAVKEALAKLEEANPERFSSGTGTGRATGTQYTTERDLHRAYNDPGNPLHNDRTGYARAYKRITGREP